MAAHLALMVAAVATQSVGSLLGEPASLPLRFQQLAHASPEAPFLLDCSGSLLHVGAGSWCDDDGSSSDSGAVSQRWTFARTHSEVVAVASALCTADAAPLAGGATPSVRVVALFGRRSPRSYVAVLAAWLAPCRALTVAPLSPWATAAELRRLLALSRPTTLALTTLSQEQANALRALERLHPEVLSTIGVVVELAADIPADILPQRHRLRPWKTALGSWPPGSSPPEPALVDSAGGRVDGDGGALALILFTSGSTASPKPVMVTHRQLRYGSDTLLRDGVGNRSTAPAIPSKCEAPHGDSARSDPSTENSKPQCGPRYKGTSSVAEPEVVAAAVSLHWDVASYDLGLALTLPAALLVLPEDAFDRPLELRRAMAQHGATVLFGTPSTLERVLLVNDPAAATRLRCAISTGEPLSATLAARCRGAIPNLQVFDCYGATEFSNVVSRLLPTAAASGQIRWGGLAFDPTTMSLRNPTADAGGRTGELVLTSAAGLMRGYLTAEMQQQAEPLPPPPREYATGDLIHVRPLR